MDQKVTEIRYEQWRRTVSECINRKAGISKRQWCDENGIRYRSLMYWQRKFQQEAIERMDNDHSLLPGQAVQVCTPVFANVKHFFTPLGKEFFLYTVSTFLHCVTDLPDCP